MIISVSLVALAILILLEACFDPAETVVASDRAAHGEVAAAAADGEGTR